jgi:hypothetical protein
MLVKLTPRVDMLRCAQHFYTNKIRSIYWQTVHIFGEWRTNLVKFSSVVWQNSAVSELVKLNGEFFMPSAVCHQLFSCGRKFGEIDT